MVKKKFKYSLHSVDILYYEYKKGETDQVDIKTKRGRVMYSIPSSKGSIIKQLYGYCINDPTRSIFPLWTTFTIHKIFYNAHIPITSIGEWFTVFKNVNECSEVEFEKAKKKNETAIYVFGLILCNCHKIPPLTTLNHSFAQQLNTEIQNALFAPSKQISNEGKAILKKLYSLMQPKEIEFPRCYIGNEQPWYSTQKVEKIVAKSEEFKGVNILEDTNQYENLNALDYPSLKILGMHFL